jgi:hypothetical protein
MDQNSPLQLVDGGANGGYVLDTLLDEEFKHLTKHCDHRIPLKGENIHPEDEYDNHFREPRGPNFGPKQVTAYMSLMGQLQWLISHVRFDVPTAVAPLYIKRTIAIISMFLAFSFINEAVLNSATNRYPSKSSGLRGRFVGVAMNAGDPKDHNLRLSPAGGENSHHVPKPVQSIISEKGKEGQRVDNLPTVDEAPYGKSTAVRTQFICEVPGHQMDHLRDYHNLLKKINQQSFKRDEDFFRLMSATAHQGPLMPQDPVYMGSAWNTLINWEDGSNTFKNVKSLLNYETVNRIITKDMPDISAQYALEKPTWKNVKKRWADYDESQLKQLFEYQFAKDRRKLAEIDPTLKGFTEIRCYLEALTGELPCYLEILTGELANAMTDPKTDPKTFIDELKAPPKDDGHGYKIKVKGSIPFPAGASAKCVVDYVVCVPYIKHLNKNFRILRPVLLWQGNTTEVPTKGE